MFINLVHCSECSPSLKETAIWLGCIYWELVNVELILQTLPAAYNGNLPITNNLKYEIFQCFLKETSMFLDFVSDKILSLSYPLVYDYGGTINWGNLKQLSTCEDVTLALLASSYP